MRFDGHHLSLNWTAVPDKSLSVTPLLRLAVPIAEALERETILHAVAIQLVTRDEPPRSAS